MKENNAKNDTPKLKLSSKAKKIIAVVVALVVVISAFIIFKTNETKIYNAVLYNFMPSSQVSELSDGTKLTIYVEKDPDYKPKRKNDSPLDALRFYYKDDNGKKVIIDENSNLEYTKSEFQMAFVMAAGEKLQTLKKVLTPIFICVIIALIVLILFLWFKSFCKREDEAKKEKYGNKNNKNSKKDKK